MCEKLNFALIFKKSNCLNKNSHSPLFPFVLLHKSTFPPTVMHFFENHKLNILLMKSRNISVVHIWDVSAAQLLTVATNQL